MTLPFNGEAAALHDPMPGMFIPPETLPAGYLEYHCRLAIRDLIALHGFEEARMLVAGYLNDEAESEHPRRVA